jgi:hypothetical protein
VATAAGLGWSLRWQSFFSGREDTTSSALTAEPLPADSGREPVIRGILVKEIKIIGILRRVVTYLDQVGMSVRLEARPVYWLGFLNLLSVAFLGCGSAVLHLRGV